MPYAASTRRHRSICQGSAVCFAMPDRVSGSCVLLMALPCLKPSPLYRPRDPQASDPWRLIGTVPIEADGSVWIEVPANTPLHFELLDLNERPLVHETAFNNVAPGEVLSCVGCHEPKATTPPQTAAAPTALKHPPHRALPQRNDLIYMGQPERSYSVMYRK
ncbi:MAG: hypothetical protein ACC628_03970 [Pirellulaceae bacterium]